MNEYNLIHDFKEGKEKAFELVFRMYYKRLIIFAIKMTYSKTEAEDIILPIFQTVFSKCADFNSIENVKAYLFVSVKNRCLNYIRLKGITDKKKMAFAEKIENEAYFHFEYSIKDDLIAAIHKLIEELPGECKRIFKMLYFEDLQPTEISNLLGITTQTVYVQKNRALNFFKSKLINKS